MKAQQNIYWLSVAHFANDFFSGVLGIMLAAQEDPLGLSETQKGIAAGLFMLVSLSQPLLGRLADRSGKHYIMLIGACFTAAGMMVAGLAGTYAILVMGVLLGGLGNSMFHPVALASARAFGGTQAKGRSIAMFMLGGNGGFGVGPFVAGFALEAFGPSGIAPLALVNLLLVPMLVWRLRPDVQSVLMHRPSDRPAVQAASAQAAVTLIVIYAVIVLLRCIPNQALSIYMPTFYKEQDYSLNFAGMATALLLVSAAVGSFLGARLSDRFSPVAIASTSMLMMPPLLFLLLRADGIWILIMSVFLGLMLNANWPILLMMGQEVFPGGASGASGLAFGWGFISNAAGSLIAGPLADAIGVQTTLEILTLLAPVGALLILVFRTQKGEYTERESLSSASGSLGSS